jgi:hypothetical protein
MNPMVRDCLAKAVKEYQFIRRTFADEGEQCGRSGGPERTATYFAALAPELYIADLVGTQV